jgi:hypothetical protein
LEAVLTLSRSIRSTLPVRLNINRETVRVLPEQNFLPEAYRLPEGTQRGAITELGPRVVFIEVTNRCNLLCQTCPRTFFDREPLKTLILKEFIAIAEQFPQMQRALLHGIGEPLLNRELAAIIRYLKGRDVEVIINSNGTLLSTEWQGSIAAWMNIAVRLMEPKMKPMHASGARTCCQNCEMDWKAWCEQKCG